MASEQKKLSDLKRGEFFRLKDSETATVWIRDEYVPSKKKYSIYKFDDANHKTLRKGATLVYVGFTF